MAHRIAVGVAGIARQTQSHARRFACTWHRIAGHLVCVPGSRCARATTARRAELFIAIRNSARTPRAGVRCRNAPRRYTRDAQSFTRTRSLCHRLGRRTLSLSSSLSRFFARPSRATRCGCRARTSSPRRRVLSAQRKFRRGDLPLAQRASVR